MPENDIMNLTCEKCKCEFTLTRKRLRERKYFNRPIYCKKCMKEYADAKRKNWFSSLSPEEQAIHRQKRKDAYNNMTDEQKEAHRQRTIDQMANRTKEEWDIINKKNSEGLKKHWSDKSREYRLERTANMRKATSESWAKLTPEQRTERARRWYTKLSDEERKVMHDELSQRMTAYNNSLSLEEKQRRAKAMEEWHNSLTPEEKAELYKRTHKWIHDMTDDEKFKYYDIMQLNRYKNTDIDKRINGQLKVVLSENNISSLAITFEKYFHDSYISNEYYIKAEVPSVNGDISHIWDYGIYKKSDDQLSMLVDLDGEFYHADNADYDGLFSSEQRDSNRILSVSGDTKVFIITEARFSRGFELMIKNLLANYDELVDMIFNQCRSIPFPSPRYTDTELLKSYYNLQRLDIDSIGIRELSINNRTGDRLIQHFHESIYMANCKDKISPYNAWADDYLLKKCIHNRIIYQSYLSPNKILQGFNVSKIAQKVSVFSAARAKLLITKYLNDCNIIYDPFSGFSGRMLGTISLGKTYIGSDISEIHINESNKMLQWMSNHDIEFNASVYQADINNSYGEYECLFTCPPYSDKEQWLDVPISTNTCDDWINICLSHFKCKKYLFVVDNTDKYKDYVVNEIINKSHMNRNSEYVILIEK